jgi:RNA polymerase sigma factor (sigma-70 family)
MTPTDDLRPLLAQRPADTTLAALYEVSDRFLRRAARRWLTRDLRQRVDSQDVAQAVWAGLVQARVRADQFPDPEHFRAFLVRAVHNRVVDLARRYGAGLAAEAPDRSGSLAGRVVDGRPRPSQEAAAAELWERMNELCPPEHRSILDLRRQGLTLDEVAARVGLHEGSVRRVLRDLARKVAFHDPES